MEILWEEMIGLTQKVLIDIFSPNGQFSHKITDAPGNNYWYSTFRVLLNPLHARAIFQQFWEKAPGQNWEKIID